MNPRPRVEAVANALRAAAPTLEPEDRGLALELYRALLGGRRVSVSELAANTGLVAEQIEATLHRWPGVFRDREGRVVGFWGLAVTGFPHRLTSAAGQVRTWCALDPLLIAPLVTPEARIESTDPLNGERISLTVTPNGVRDVVPSTAVISMLVPDGNFDHDVVQRFCHYVLFFESQGTGRQWIAEHPRTFLLTVEEAFQVAQRAWPSLFRGALPALVTTR